MSSQRRARPEGSGQRRRWEGTALVQSPVGQQEEGQGRELEPPEARLLQSVHVGGGGAGGCTWAPPADQCGEVLSCAPAASGVSTSGVSHTMASAVLPQTRTFLAFARKSHPSPCLPLCPLVVKREPLAATEGAKRTGLWDVAAGRGGVSPLKSRSLGRGPVLPRGAHLWPRGRERDTCHVEQATCAGGGVGSG